MNENSGDIRDSVESSLPKASSLPRKYNRKLASLCLAVIGVPVGAAICSFGYVGIVFILESFFVPPLQSPDNYGQFGFLPIMFGFFGLFYGVSFALIPYSRFLLWLPAFALISFFVFSGDIGSSFDAIEVTCTAMIVVGALIILLALTVSMVIRRLERLAE